ncbi:dTDP-3-amino-3,4,6-trideoxy-alpha-D-glucose transaminase [Fundidesulfovibrio magnetotacticus]|uniref:dTDP-3-amino-3,4,6-trideoxy-alpha-D-glucose transaminase n=1 Tax=Fundidesulfovibrio magnetotacticus TaxID=2730080 RepID=A0A6V8LMC1_9BACT|nr:DegT/DnrJ/EryC1/StrS family aminotransferase [Fundidesulfovibrio magnetotacticus]GFK93823.1 dTDP-3-amino-3,4,6-trideoxy-alpha-D-glucose transaminase [Fundidesulfovibrio magnetotacticus]
MRTILKRLAVVVPVYGNEASLPELYERIDAATRGLDVELTLQFVNDRSPDGSQAVLESLAARDPRVRVILLSRNHGSFTAIAAGMAQVATHDAVVILSADLQDPPELIPEMVRRWRAGIPVVLCSRKDRDDPLASRLFSRAFWWSFRRFAMPDMPPGGFDFCLIDRRVVRVILESSEKKTSLVGLILWAGFERSVIPYERAARKHGRSMWSMGRKLAYAFHSLVAFSSLPMKLFAGLGLVVGAAGVLMAFYVLLANLFGWITVPGWSALMLMQTVILATVLLGFGVLGGYLWINLEQTRRRPLFIVDKTVGQDLAPGDRDGRVDFFSLERVSAPARHGLREAAHRALASRRIILGPEVERFERAFARYVGAPHAVGVANGTDSITLALWALGVEPGSLVAVPALTAPPTAVAVLRAGCVPLFMDVDPQTLLLPASAVARAAALGAKAVVPVHLYGNLCDMPAIRAEADRLGLVVIEDCAQSTGSEAFGRHCGTWGHAASFSFYPTKNLGTYGDGGAVVTADPGVAQRLVSMRFYGQDASGVCVLPGMNSRLDEMQAALLTERLACLDEHNARRVAVAARYDQALSALDPVPGQPGRVPHLYVVRPDERAEFRRFLSERGVDTGVHYSQALNRHPYLAAQGRVAQAPESQAPAAPGTVAVAHGPDARSADAGCPTAEAAAARVTSLPCYPGIPEAHVERVVEACREWAARG